MISNIPFDQYQRYKHVQLILNMLPQLKEINILEVGANSHKNLERFLPNIKITYLDLVVPEYLKSNDAYIEGDATNMDFDDNSFDFIVALDVYEHIPLNRKEAFISELSRVSKLGFIIGAPFHTQDVRETEIRLNSYYEVLYGQTYKWLDEHIEIGLPKLDDTLKSVQQNGLNYFHFSHGSLNVWEKLMRVHFAGASNFVLHPYRFKLDDFYNSKMFDRDYGTPAYRQFIVCSKENEIIERVQLIMNERIAKSSKSNNTEVLHQLDDLEKSFYSLVERIEIEKGINKVKESLETEKEIEILKDELSHVKVELKKQLKINDVQVKKIMNLNQEIEQKEITLGTILQKNKDLNESNYSLTQHVYELEQVAQALRIKNRVKGLFKLARPIKIGGKSKKLFKLLQMLKANPVLLEKTLQDIKLQGIKNVKFKIENKVKNELEIYVPETKFDMNDYITKINNFDYKPKISIAMPVYNVKPIWLEKAIESIVNQIYTNWELCIVDDGSDIEETKQYLKNIKNDKIKVFFSPSNNGISEATNKAISLSDAEYIALMDNDDEITNDALFEIVKSLNEQDADILYSDEDKIDKHGKRKLPFFKPNWSPDLLRSQMYLGHLIVFKKSLFESIGGFRKEYDGSQDYDLILRMSEHTSKIFHIPKVLYSWREIETSTAINPASKPYSQIAGLKALQEHVNRVYGDGNAWVDEEKDLFVYDVRYKLPDPQPMVSIIIPTKDNLSLLEQCIKSILGKTTYTNYEIIILNNNSEKQETYIWFDNIVKTNNNVKVLNAFYDFNWSKLNNHGIKAADGEVYVFLNNDTVIITENWLDRLAEKALRPDVGTVGGLLLYEDETIQHAGVILGMGGWADHVFKGSKPVHFSSPFISPMVTRNVLASTGACLAISKETIAKIGLFNEDFIVCGSDVEISVRAYKLGYVNIYDPHVKLYHLESKTRDSHVPESDFTYSSEHYSPFREEGDPYFNNNLDLMSLVPKMKKEEIGCYQQ
ncbi:MULTISPECIES: glycosyltransferase [Bacillaceae]|uniref:glycosyltransferase n=1 Tax=Bacillaceae TaxID=186817 RepID=UPI002963E1A6|nr:glycosyltransferase [Bacillus infantis]MDW2876419.1 glycosyltransferase [Bacillus infantis]